MPIGNTPTLFDICVHPLQHLDDVRRLGEVHLYCCMVKSAGRSSRRMFATAAVHTESSVYSHRGPRNSKSFVSIGFHSYTEPTMSPTIAPHMLLCLLALRAGNPFEMPGRDQSMARPHFGGTGQSHIRPPITHSGLRDAVRRSSSHVALSSSVSHGTFVAIRSTVRTPCPFAPSGKRASPARTSGSASSILMPSTSSSAFPQGR